MDINLQEIGFCSALKFQNMISRYFDQKSPHLLDERAIFLSPAQGERVVDNQTLSMRSIPKHRCITDTMALPRLQQRTKPDHQ